MLILFRTARVIGALLLIGALSGAPARADGAPTLVLAHYMHCYVLGAYAPSDPRVADPSATDIVAGPPMRFESEWYDAGLARRAAGGEAASRVEFETIHKAGIDAIGLLLAPDLLPKSQFAAGLDLVAATAARSPVKIVPELWGDPWKSDFTAFGQHVKAFMEAHPGAFVLRDGKPVFLFAPDSAIEKRVHDPATAPTDQLEAFFAPWGGSKGVYLIAYTPWAAASAARSPVVEHAQAVGVWGAPDDFASPRAAGIDRIGSLTGKAVAFPITPSFYQRRSGKTPQEYGNSFGAARYIDGWMQAIRMRPAFVDLQTWNDFSEDSALVPTNAAGSTWLTLTAYLRRWLALGHAPPLDHDAVLLFHPKQLATATLDDPNATVTNFAWRHRAPVADYIDVVTMLTAPAEGRLTLGRQSWTKALPAGLHDWVVYAPQSDPPLRTDKVAAASLAYPTASGLRSVDVAETLAAARPAVEIRRQGHVVAQVASKLPFLDKAPFQDLTVIADEAGASRSTGANP